MLKCGRALLTSIGRNSPHTYHLLPLKQPVCHKLSGPDSDSVILQKDTCKNCGQFS